ncbi:MAG: metallophosphoesterase [Candidatus Gracilibacteria bacterium]|nr:metallophosphoesterase [Candidatus Gracilibacteria bacterium]
MKVAIISDIHENVLNLTLFLKEIENHDIKKIIFLGDFINNGIAKMLAACEVPVYAIWGNNDGDRVAITKTSFTKGSNLEVGFDTFDMIEIENRKIFITHYPMLARPMAKSGDFDAVFYGHDHIYNIDQINDCLIVDPGEISAHKTNVATFAIYDSETNKAEIIKIKGTISVQAKDEKTFKEKSWIEFSESKTHKY